VLVAATASGCCAAYRLPDTRSSVLVLTGGHLRPLRWAAGGRVTVLFDQGRGDQHAGIRCGPDGLHLRVALDEGGTARLTDTPVVIAGGVARRGPPTSSTVRGDRARAETRSRCPGLDAQGWAA
jgi:hypothetical protein